jgi:hypothetical protein
MGRGRNTAIITMRRPSDERTNTSRRTPLNRLHATGGSRPQAEYVADHLGHKNIQNPRFDAQITNPLGEQVFHDLDQHPEIVWIS